MDFNNNLSEISAEMLLGYFYPELVGQWKAHHMGTFYRNYNRDVLDLYEEEHTVVLSRDGFLQLLPKGLLTTEDKAKSDKSRTTSDQQRRISMLQDAFLPFDTYWFNKKLQVELQISDMLRSKLEYLLKEYFDFDLSAQTNFYVQQAAVLLPFVKNKRGDFHFIEELLSTLVHCKTEMTVGRYSDSDTNVSWLPKVNFNLFVKGLSAAEYRSMQSNLEPLYSFIREWLVPMEVVCYFNIKEYGWPQHVGERLTLNYNTEL